MGGWRTLGREREKEENIKKNFFKVESKPYSPSPLFCLCGAQLNGERS